MLTEKLLQRCIFDSKACNMKFVFSISQFAWIKCLIFKWLKHFYSFETVQNRFQKRNLVGKNVKKDSWVHRCKKKVFCILFIKSSKHIIKGKLTYSVRSWNGDSLGSWWLEGIRAASGSIMLVSYPAAGTTLHSLQETNNVNFCMFIFNTSALLCLLLSQSNSLQLPCNRGQ